MKIKTMLLFFLLPVLLSAQENKSYPIAKQVFNKKLSAREILNTSLFMEEIVPLKGNRTRKNKLEEGVLVQTDQSIVDRLLNYPASFIQLKIPTDIGTFIELELFEVNVLSEGSIVRSSSAPNQVVIPASGKHYRGIVKDKPGSLAAISIFEDQLMGLISTARGNLVIGKMNDGSNMHVIYNDKDLIDPIFPSCEMEDDGIAYHPSELSYEGSRALSDCVRIYVEVDKDIFDDKGNTTNAVNYVTGLFNQCFILYNNESINMSISEIFVWDTTSPYAGTSTLTLLNQFQGEHDGFNGDLAHLVTYKGGGGRAAGFNGICNADPDLSMCVTGIDPTYSTVPTYSWSVKAATHEMGHLLGSRHTHACVWNGNSTGIDGCAPGGMEGSCANPGNPSAGGTIMSYCQHQSVGINFSLGFGTQPGNVIRNSVTNASCLMSGTAFDLWISDLNGDIGNEPNNESSPIYYGDIWNCQNDPNCLSDENPEYKISGSNFMRVRVQNRGCNTSDPASLLMYWTFGKTGETWDLDWLDPVHRPANVINGCPGGGEVTVFAGPNAVSNPITIPALSPGESIILTKSWRPPNPDVCFPGHNGNGRMLCYLGRIESTGDPMFNESSGSIFPNVRNNNNIATHNSWLFNANPNDFRGGGGEIIVNMENPENTPFTVVFNRVNLGNLIPFSEYGYIRLRLNPELFEAWVNGGMQGEGVELVENNLLQVVDGEAASLDNVLYNPDLRYSIQPEFYIHEDHVFEEEETSFFFQLNHSTDTEPEGNSAGIYHVRISSECSIDIQNEFLSETPGECITIGEDFNCPGCEYIWEPQEGLDDPFASQTDACVEETTTYQLTVFNPEYGCEYTEEVTIFTDYASPNSRETDIEFSNLGVRIEPNPLSTNTIIRFDLKQLNDVSIDIYNIDGRLIASPLKNESREAGPHHVRFNSNGLPRGLYFCKVQIGDEIESLKMIIQ